MTLQSRDRIELVVTTIMDIIADDGAGLRTAADWPAQTCAEFAAEGDILLTEDEAAAVSRAIALLLAHYADDAAVTS